MKKYLILTFLLVNLISCKESYTQEKIKDIQTSDLYMPKEIKQAYKKGTRAYDGKPGKNYFVNKTDYVIKVEFNPKTRKITGKETIKLKNNSPDELKRIVFNLDQDIYKKGNARSWDITAIDLHDGVKIEKLKVNNKEIEVTSKQINNYQSVYTVRLDESIKAGETAEIEVEWNLIIPGTINIRNGTYEGDNFFIGYWYPKIAVYDDIVGWDTHGHRGNLEFYNDFGDFDVEITVPGEYNVWSSGILQNSKKLLKDKFLSRLEKAAKSKEVVNIITLEERKKNERITKSGMKHTWKFKAKYIPDFAFAVSKTYLWDATTANNGESKIAVHSVYKQDATDFYNVCEYTKKIIEYFSEDTPGIPYPYPQMTAFNGSGGMEFPGMVNDGKAGNKTYTIYLTAHEVGHTYFPFYTGLNEEKYAWMDEGLITFFPSLVTKALADDESYNPAKNLTDSYNRIAGSFDDVPLMILSESTGPYAYRFHAYSKPATAFYCLYKYIGKDKFNKGLQEFVKRWNGKHPIPYDFFFTFNEVAGEDLAWFWKPWFFEIGYADLAIGEIKTGENESKIIILNKGNNPVPIKLKVIYKNGDAKEFTEKMNIWKGKINSISIKVPKGDIQKVILDTENVPDAFPEDNVKELYNKKH